MNFIKMLPLNHSQRAAKMDKIYKFLLRQSIHAKFDFSSYLKHLRKNQMIADW